MLLSIGALFRGGNLTNFYFRKAAGMFLCSGVLFVRKNCAESETEHSCHSTTMIGYIYCHVTVIAHRYSCPKHKHGGGQLPVLMLYRFG